MVGILGGPEQEAREALLACCGSRSWVEVMLARRPFGTADDVHRAAADAFDSLSSSDWLDAFAAHPRIGERKPAVDTGARAADWSAAEQSIAAAADEDTKAALIDANRAYEDRFGHIYLVSAAGRTADELLADCLARMANDPKTELRVAADEQRKITSARLSRLVESTP